MEILPNIEWLLDYEIRLSTRYRRFLSFVMVSAADKDPTTLDQVLSETIRSSDVRFLEQNGISVVMGETGKADAVHAIERYKRTLSGSMNARYAVATFPSDGKTSVALRHTALKRLKKACTLGSGAIVAGKLDDDDSAFAEPRPAR